MGRKAAQSPERLLEVFGAEVASLPAARLQRQGGSKFSRRSGASFKQRVAAGGRGSGSSAAVSVASRMGEQTCQAGAQVGAPIRHRAEGRVKSGEVYPTSREAAGHGALGQGDDPVFDARPSTSRGASASLEHVEKELLDYDKEVEEHVASVPRGDWMEMPRVVRKVVQRDHLGGHRQELVAGNLQ
ncbi:hypothetical protein NDU88_002731 [Pleurodeles waltl]|uniref:Uncharacterized protein n=1 Tax=Pleurodeles waltl TaxID=8319 RepID=A0AAV7RCW3_PLEWA|nr:hypothetical protein NDU88_002731 [Pleurodeles waltl]